MKKLLFVLGMWAIGFARADNIVTSREYVDGQANTLQNTLPAKNENTVLLNTATAGAPGEKAIYNASADYATQSDALVTAGTFNTAVQNALESEFVCIERQNGNGGCLLYEIHGGTPKSASKNLFDINNAKIIYNTTNSVQATKTSTGFSLTNGAGFNFILLEIGSINDLLGKTLRVSANASCTNGVQAVYNIGYSNDDATQRTASGVGGVLVVKEVTGRTKVVLWLYASRGGNEDRSTVCTYSNIQVEEGENATAYEPYKNLYLPAGD